MARPPGIPQAAPRATPRRDNRVKLSGYLQPQLYEKARTAADQANLSVGAYLERLIDADQVDEDGRPLWADSPARAPEQLPLAG